MGPVRIAVVGLGKISIDQHIPAISADDGFTLVAAASIDGTLPDLPVYSDIIELLKVAEVDAIAVNTPPQVRFAIARQALLAGKHVLLEKPPCATLAQLALLERLARERGVALYTAWHSQHAPAVAPARAWLRNKRIRRVSMTWGEDVRFWHPGQKWLWQPGGFGVFDPGINALSILTAVLPADLIVDRAHFEVPANCQAPVGADLSGSVGDGCFTAKLDFLQTGTQTWTLVLETDRGTAEIGSGGACLSFDGAVQEIGPSREYASIYRRLAELIAVGETEVDARPLVLVADAFLIAERILVEDFFD